MYRSIGPWISISLSVRLEHSKFIQVGEWHNTRTNCRKSFSKMILYGYIVIWRHFKHLCHLLLFVSFFSKVRGVGRKGTVS